MTFPPSCQIQSFQLKCEVKADVRKCPEARAAAGLLRLASERPRTGLQNDGNRTGHKHVYCRLSSRYIPLVRRGKGQGDHFDVKFTRFEDKRFQGCDSLVFDSLYFLARRTHVQRYR
ncbi:hypothetical protein NDU88_002861 [Pleurodeles waltl]|uniref:Uncharacterized protein n=1 Tax=Pleurodeles waltl TaxID=8319 RepID=A0AAV7VBS2_PLEWA|nr:hypothetical protein NDU88_002861 [Pleurodeles waltl]